jgi:hypothetical protein
MQAYKGVPAGPARFVMAIDRLLAWGMDPATREAMLAEQTADWDAMSQDPDQAATRRMMARQLRGIPSAIWWRLSRGETTTIPASVALMMLSVVVTIDTVMVGYTAIERISELVSALGLATVAWQLMRMPRRIEVARFRMALLLVAVGSVASMFAFNGFEDPVTDTVLGTLLGYSLEMGMFLAGAGCVTLLVGSTVNRHRSVVLSGGSLVVIGTSIFAGADAVWGVWSLQTDTLVAVTTLLVALGATLFAQMVFRLRKLEIT